MTDVRRAAAADAPEVARLRGVMLAAIDRGEHRGEPSSEQRTGPFDGVEGAAPGPWAQATIARLREWADDPDVAILVVEKADGLAACAIGVIEQSLGDPDNPQGLRGRIFNVATDPEHRRRGYARACTVAVLEWFDARGVPVVDLHATPEGAPLYRDLGFSARTVPSMRRARPTHT